jgi:hypothetical protein
VDSLQRNEAARAAFGFADTNWACAVFAGAELMPGNRQRNSQGMTRQDFIAVQQMRAANHVLGASYARDFRDQNEALESVIDDNDGSGFPLMTSAQTLAGAINELHSSVGGGGGGSGNNYFPGGW